MLLVKSGVLKYACELYLVGEHMTVVNRLDMDSDQPVLSSRCVGVTRSRTIACVRHQAQQDT